MERNKNLLLFTGKKDAVIFVDALAGAEIRLELSRRLDVRYTDSDGGELGRGEACVFMESGVYRIVLPGDNAGECDVALVHDERLTPFLMPGAGVLWNHGSVFPLLLKKGCAHTLYAVGDPAFGTKTACIKGAGDAERIGVYAADGSRLKADWYPKLREPWFWTSAELPGGGELIRFELEAGKADVRFTLLNCNIVSLSQPTRAFRTGGLRLVAEDEQGSETDARFELFVEGERVALYDALAGESPLLTLPVGAYLMRVGRGVEYETAEQLIRVEAGESEAVVRPERVLRIPEGWALGELHTHSALEDASLFPGHVMRAARANGRNFCFLTDKEVDKLLEYGVDMCDQPGRFIGLARQEIMCHELHMNVLNTDRRIDNPEADDLMEVHPDIEARIARWLEKIREIQRERPCAFVLNHPMHRPDAAGMPYFRSWWVADVFREFRLVENFSYEGWFNRLNRGRKLYARGRETDTTAR